MLAFGLRGCIKGRELIKGKKKKFTEFNKTGKTDCGLNLQEYLQKSYYGIIPPKEPLLFHDKKLHVLFWSFHLSSWFQNHGPVATSRKQPRSVNFHDCTPSCCPYYYQPRSHLRHIIIHKRKTTFWILTLGTPGNWILGPLLELQKNKLQSKTKNKQTKKPPITLLGSKRNKLFHTWPFYI